MQQSGQVRGCYYGYVKIGEGTCVKARRRIAAVLEVLGIYVASQFVMALLARVFNLGELNPFGSLSATMTGAELREATGQFFVLLLLQYGSYFVLIVPINWWHRRQGPAAYGLTKAGRTWSTLLLAGGATAALAAWPSISVLLADAVYDLGETVPWRQALFDTSWRRWEFWLFMAVMSFALIPVLEELFYRGYCQRRLAEDWGDGPAIIGTSLLFVFTHGQYLMLNAYNVSLIAGLIVLTFGFGIVFAWTRSLVPSIFAHALINVPMTPPWQALLLAAFLIAAIILLRRGWGVAKSVFAGTSVVACVVLGTIGVIWAVIGHRFEWLQYVAAGMVLAAIIFEAVDRNRALTSAATDSGMAG